MKNFVIYFFDRSNPGVKMFKRYAAEDFNDAEEQFNTEFRFATKEIMYTKEEK